MIRKLRIKFVAINMAIVTIMLCTIFGMVYHFTRSSLEKDSIAMMQRIAEKPFQHQRPGNIDRDLQLPFFTVEISAQGTMIAEGGGYYDLSDEEFLVAVTERVSSSYDPVGILPEYNLRFCRQVTPMGQMIVFSDMSNEHATLHHLLRNSAMIGSAGLLAFLGISILLANWAIHPVDLAWKQQKQFVADASHELKTPLTVITTNAELLRAEDVPSEVQGFSDNILNMAHHMRTLVEQMLELARADHTDPAVFAPVALSELVTEEYLSFEAVLYEQGLTASLKTEDGIRVLGNETGLRQVLEILLDNAGKYTTSGGTVECCLKRNGRKKCLLSVATTGQPLSKEDLKNIFKRFVRLDEARSRTGSFGLGLSIAQTTVEAHKGKIWAQSADGINTFYVQLPTAD